MKLEGDSLLHFVSLRMTVTYVFEEGLLKKYSLTAEYAKPAFAKATAGKSGAKGAKLKQSYSVLCVLCIES